MTPLHRGSWSGSKLLRPSLAAPASTLPERGTHQHLRLHSKGKIAETPTGDHHPPTQTPGRRSSWLKEDQKVWRCVSVSEDPPPPGDTL
ncbi:unnamed protein product [Arctogadus glacialis]